MRAAPEGQGAIRGEGGSMIPALALLMALALLSGLWGAALYADSLVALRKKAERTSFYAAEGVLEKALAELAPYDPSILPRDALLAPSPGFAVSPRSGTLGGWEYRWGASFLADGGDEDGDPATPLVLFDRSFGYEGSPFPAGGYPVVKIDLSVSRGEARRDLTAVAAPLCLDLPEDAAWTAAGPLAVEGPFRVSGMDHDVDGVPKPGSDAVPAIMSPGGIALLGGAFVPAGAGGEILAEVPGIFQGLGPADVLDEEGFPGGLDGLAEPGEGSDLRGVVWAKGGFQGPLRGEGVLIVHNPLYVPRLYEASRLALEEGVLTEGFDPLYSHLDPRNQPAPLEVLEGGTFRGLVIADSPGGFHAAASIIGGLVTLAESPATALAREQVEVLFSRESLRLAGLGPLREVVALKALPGVERPPE